MPQSHPHFIPSTFQVSFPVPIHYIVPKISPSPRLCEIFRNAVSCYGIELLATRPTTQLEDIPCRMSVAVYSLYCQITSIRGSHFLHSNLRITKHRNDRDALITAHYTPPLFLFL